MPFRILILGDGNFSFALAVAQMLGGSDASAAWEYMGLTESRSADWHMLATSFDSRDEVYEKYPESRSILARLDSLTPRVDVRHGINAWALPDHFGMEFHDGFDCIIWNHPVRHY